MRPSAQSAVRAREPTGVDADRPGLAWVAALVAGLAMVWVSWQDIRKGIWVDLDVYVAGGQAVLDRVDLYSISVHDLPFTYPPFAAVLFAPLALLPVWLARVVMTVATVAALVLAVEVLRRRMRLAPLAIVPIVVVGVALEPFLRTVLLGQVNALLIALVVLDCLVVPARHRGWLVGVAAAVKLTPAVFVVWFLLRREWAAAGRAAAAGAVSVGLGFAVAPSSSWFYWTGGFGDLGRFGSASVLGVDNQSLSSAVARLAGLTSVPTLLALLCGVLGVIVGAVAARACLRRGDDVGALLAVAIGGLLASPVSWSHHWLWVVPLIAWCVATGHRISGVLLGAVFWLGPFWAVYRVVPSAEAYAPGERVVATVYVLTGVVMLVVLGLARQRAPAVSST